MTEKWSPMIAHVAKSYVICPNCKQETHEGSPPNLWEMRKFSYGRGDINCDNCKMGFKLSKRIVFKDEK